MDKWLDLTVAGYLPSFPKVGAKAVLEKHFSNQVSLLEATTPQNRPYLLNLEASYTPIPMLAVVAQGHLTSKSRCVMSIGLQLNYYLGTPLRQQLDGDMVANMRTIEFAERTFVPRNW